MNIALISPRIYPFFTGGYEIFNYYLVNELSVKCDKLWVFTWGNYSWNNKNVINVKLLRRMLIFKSPSVTFHILLNLKKLKQQIDIIHVPYTSNSEIVYSMLLSKKFFNIPYIIYIHGGGMYPWKKTGLQKKFFKNSNGIIAVSETIQREYEKRSGKKIKVILPLIPFKELKINKEELKTKYCISSTKTIILYLGSIKNIKGCDVLLNAFLNLGKEYIKKNNLLLIYVGDGPMKSNLMDVVIHNSLKEYVKFYGNVPNEKVAEMYKLADIYVIPSLFEGTPKSLLEAMYNGLPVIGSNTTGINNLIINNENGLLFNVSNENELSIKLKKLIENKNLRNKLGENSLKYIKENYDYKKTIDEFLNFYREVVK